MIQEEIGAAPGRLETDGSGKPQWQPTREREPKVSYVQPSRASSGLWLRMKPKCGLTCRCFSEMITSVHYRLNTMKKQPLEIPSTACLLRPYADSGFPFSSRWGSVVCEEIAPVVSSVVLAGDILDERFV